jgi:uncharacterized protein (DUF1778 family)
MAKATTQTRTDNINIRVSPDMLGLIDRAARVFGKTRTNFILDTVRQAAEDAILDQRLFILDESSWQAFNVALDQPLAENTKLQTLLARKPAWEK